MSPDEIFQFDYSPLLPKCQPEGSTRPSSDDDTCVFPVCDDQAIGCLTYPDGEYRGSNFSWASVSVSILKGLNSEPQCLADMDRNACSLPRTEKHHRVTFGAADCTEGGLGHYLEHKLYRTYHRGACYQLSISMATTEFANYPPGTVKKFSQKDREAVMRILRTPLETFRFRK